MSPNEPVLVLSRCAMTAVAMCSILARLVVAQDKAATVEESRPTAAVLAGREPYRLEFDHVSGQFALFTHRGQLLSRSATLGTAVPARVPPDRPLELVVVNANSLLYQYSVASRPLGGRRVRACRDVGSEFTTSGLAIGISAIAGGSSMPSFSAVVKEWPEIPPLKADTRFGAVTQEELADATRRTNSAVAQFTAFTDRLEDLVAASNDSLGYVAELAESTPIDTLLTRLRRYMATVHPDLAEGTLVPRAVLGEYRKVASLAAELTSMLEGIGGVGAPGAEIPGTPAAQSALRDASASLLRARRAGRDLQRTLARMDGAHAAARRVFLLEPTPVAREITVELSEVPAAASDSLVRLRLGSLHVYTTPAASLLCNIEAGFTIMTPPPDYIVEQNTNIVLDRSDGSSLRSSVALLLDVAAPAFAAVGVVTGLGLSANSSAPDLYVGGSLRALAPFHITIGSVWQRKQRLPSGLSVGEEAPPGSSLTSLKRRYAPNFFFGLMLAR